MIGLLACAAFPGGGDADADAERDGPSVDFDPVCEPVEVAASAPRAARTVTGSVQWTLSFDEAAEDAGFYDCAYSRTYDGFVETVDRGWLCPDCDWFTTGTAVLPDDELACYAQITSDDGTRVEHLGVGQVDGEAHLYRSGRENVSLADMGAWGADGVVSWEDDAEIEAGGTLHLAAAGTLTAAESANETVIDDPGTPSTYECGWPACYGGGAPDGYEAALGEPFPDFRLKDQCDDDVRLWDFQGRWLVLDASAVNCGPCQTMARGEAAFVEEMAAGGYPVEVITLLAAELSDIAQPADLETRQDWASTFGTSAPILGDLGFGYAVMAPYVGDGDGGMAFPTIVVLDREMKLLGGTAGFGDDGWDEIRAVIEADAGS